MPQPTCCRNNGAWTQSHTTAQQLLRNLGAHHNQLSLRLSETRAPKANGTKDNQTESYPEWFGEETLSVEIHFSVRKTYYL